MIKIKLFDVYIMGRNLFKNSGQKCFRDFLSVFEDVFGFDRNSVEFIDNKDKLVSEFLYKSFFEKINRLLKSEPVQYILGYEIFCDLKLKVGPGVFIPRQDTCVLIDLVVKKLKKNSKLMDLCAGSGAIGLAFKKSKDDIEVSLLEKSKKAFGYLSENVLINNVNVNLVNDDVFCYYKKVDDYYFDAVVSNPPYISEEELHKLPEEVKREPLDALLGGGDGLYFFEEICRKWKNKIKNDGFIAFEFGNNQCCEVRNILLKNGFLNQIIERDICGIPRFVLAFKSL